MSRCCHCISLSKALLDMDEWWPVLGFGITQALVSYAWRALGQPVLPILTLLLLTKSCIPTNSTSVHKINQFNNKHSLPQKTRATLSYHLVVTCGLHIPTDMLRTSRRFIIR